MVLDIYFLVLVVFLLLAATYSQKEGKRAEMIFAISSVIIFLGSFIFWIWYLI